MVFSKSFQSEIQETVEKIYSGLAPESKREADESLGLSEFERATGIISAHRFKERSQADQGQGNLRLFGGHFVGAQPLIWPQAVERFKISKVHENANLEMIYPGIKKMLIDWSNNLSSGQSIYLSGSPGCGKTYASIALLRYLIDRQRYPWIIYKKSDELDDELLKAVAEKQESYVLEKYHEVPILFIDDLGVERVNERIIKQYYSIIDRRMNNLLPTVFTSNISLCEIGKNLGDRIASRLQMAMEILFPKKDYRQRG